MDRISEPVKNIFICPVILSIYTGGAKDKSISLFHPVHYSRDIIVVDTNAINCTSFAGSAGNNPVIGKIDNFGFCTGSAAPSRTKQASLRVVLWIGPGLPWIARIFIISLPPEVILLYPVRFLRTSK